jgi:hypothetical protein
MDTPAVTDGKLRTNDVTWIVSRRSCRLGAR